MSQKGRERGRQFERAKRALQHAVGAVDEVPVFDQLPDEVLEASGQEEQDFEWRRSDAKFAASLAKPIERRRLISLDDVAKLFGDACKRTIKRLMEKDQRFPRPVQCAIKRVLFWEHEVQRYMEALQRG